MRVGEDASAPPNVARTWSTDDVAPESAVDYWRSVRRHVYADVSTEPHTGEFTGSISSACYGEYSVSTKRASGERVLRSGRLIGRSTDDPDYVFAVLPTRGTGFIEQAGNSARFGPGEMICYDSSLPFEMNYDGGFEQVVVHLPADQAFATSGVRRGAELLATPIALDGALSSVASFFLSLAHTQLDDPVGAAILAPQVTGLAGSLLAYASSTMGEQDLPLLLRREQVVEYMRRHLSDPDLDIQSIAVGCHVSRRSLYRIFEGSGQSVAGRLRLLRVEAAQKLLAAQGNVSIGSVARHVGFSSEAQFYRTFRSITGATPGEYRQLRSGAAVFGRDGRPIGSPSLDGRRAVG
ncbi:helix-turn-helix domain-containing protein [Gordonia sp. TBRC 11910]|uniref:Helix-turn-helix domain-containing protein n=1 Tax=Gordonia asplenii TaxID=2725283 RepID=A0A848L4U7_9ACTN|nr:helix-turn-helix domain-containing protein [Gordonia asplenii]NMO02638.1 helix-turn-helix domain-containing protein [Gordonia asplenii]